MKTQIAVKTSRAAIKSPDEVELSSDEKSVVTIRAGATVQTVCGLAADEFPPLPVMPDKCRVITFENFCGMDLQWPCIIHQSQSNTHAGKINQRKGN